LEENFPQLNTKERLSKLNKSQFFAKILKCDKELDEMNCDDVKKEYEKLLKRTEIFNKDFEYIFQNYNNENNFMFLDPPYDSEFTDYGYCTFGKKEHEKLATCFKNTDIKCLMIIGKTPFIEELYHDYIVDEYDKKYRFKLHSGRIGDDINTKHLVIKNF